MSQTEPTAKHHQRGQKSRVRWNKFTIVGERAILRASSSTQDPRFKPMSRGRQGHAACMVAIALAHLIEPCDWTSELLDRVLEYADRLFRVSRARALLPTQALLHPEQLQPEFFIGDYKCTLCTESNKFTGNLSSDTHGATNIYNALTTFLRDHDFGILTSQGTTIAVLKHSLHEIFYFDPDPSNDRGKRDLNGVACLIRLKEVNEILEIFSENLDKKCISKYSIDKISLIRMKPIGREKYDCDLLNDIMMDGKRLDPAELQHKDDEFNCPEVALKNDHKSWVNDKTDQLFLKKIPLKIEMTNYTIGEKFASVPLIDQTIRDENYKYENTKVNVPTTFKTLPGVFGISILHGWTNESSDLYKNKGAQSVANCVAAIAVKETQPVKTWLRNSLDEILTIGDIIHTEIKSDKPNIKNMTVTDLDDVKIKVGAKEIVVNIDLLTVIGTFSSKEHDVLGLKQGLEEFFLKNINGVLECSRNVFAIWKEDDYYYLFDSKPCDMTGLHIDEKRNGKEDKKDKAETSHERKIIGKCCVICFASQALLYSHLKKNMESAKPSDQFTICRIDIEENLPGIRAWNFFKPATKGKNWILMGSIDSENEIFEEHSRGLQGLAISVAALILATGNSPSTWSREDVDDVIKEGDAYFNWCIPNSESEGDEENKSLNTKTLKKHLYFKNCKIKIDVEDSCIVGDLRALSYEDTMNLETGITEFFKNHQFGIIESNNYYFAIWKWNQELKDKSVETSYYLFNGKPTEEFLQQALSFDSESDVKPKSFACVLRYVQMTELAHIIEEELKHEKEDSMYEFFIHDIRLISKSEPMTLEEITEDKMMLVKPELRAYIEAGDSGALLLGSFNQMDEKMFKSDTRDKQQAANALITLAMAKLYDPHLWIPRVLDDILKIGNKLCSENLENIPEESEENPEIFRNYILPHEIEKPFFLGVNEINADVQNESAIGNLNDLTKILGNFFSNNKMGIFRSEQSMLPIWKEDSIYFTMDPKGKREGVATVYWYLDINSLTIILRECCTASANKFIIDGVNIENRYIGTEQEPEDYIAEDHWFNFSKLIEGEWSINCNISTSDERFEEKNRGHQCAAMSIMAIIFSKVYEPRHWSTEILDEVMITGDKLHSQSSARFGRNESFKPNQILSEFFLSDRRIDLDIQDCVEAGKLESENGEVVNISAGILNFFEKFIAGCLTLPEGKYLAIWNHDGVFFCFEPGVSLFRFEKIDSLAKLILLHGEKDADYEIANVSIIDWNKLQPWKFDPSPAVRPANLPPLNAYCRLQGMINGKYNTLDLDTFDLLKEVLCRSKIRNQKNVSEGG